MLSTFATLYKRNHFSIARTFRTMTLIRSMLSSGRSDLVAHLCDDGIFRIIYRRRIV